MRIEEALKRTPYRFYDVDGQITFPFYASDGNISTRKVAYLWVRPFGSESNKTSLTMGPSESNAGFTYGLEFDAFREYEPEEVLPLLANAAKDLSVFMVGIPA